MKNPNVSFVTQSSAAQKMVFFLQLPLRLAKLPSVHCAILTVCALSRVSCKMSSVLSHSSSLKYDLKHLHKSHIERWASSSFRVLVKRGMSQTAENWPLSQDPRSYKTYTEEKDQSSFFLRTYILIVPFSRYLLLVVLCGFSEIPAPGIKWQENSTSFQG